MMSSLHYKYIIFILSIALVALVTKVSTPDTALTQYVSFAATISSLILAVLAIIQGFISTNSNEMAVANLHKSSLQIAENSKKLTGLIEEFDAKFKDMPEQISNISQKIETQFFQITSNTQDKKDSKPTLSKENINYILDHSSNGNVIAMYAAALSTEKNKHFDYNNMFLNQSYNDFANGYYNAMSSLGIIKVERKKEERLMKISNFSISSIEMEKRLDIIRQKNKGKEDVLKFYEEIIERINGLFL